MRLGTLLTLLLFSQSDAFAPVRQSITVAQRHPPSHLQMGLTLFGSQGSRCVRVVVVIVVLKIHVYHDLTVVNFNDQLSSCQLGCLRTRFDADDG
jgi:hypothetical protein